MRGEKKGVKNTRMDFSILRCWMYGKREGCLRQSVVAHGHEKKKGGIAYRSSREPPKMRGFFNLLPTQNKKRRRMPSLLFGAGRGILAFSSAPRSAIINGVLCRQYYCEPTFLGKAFCSRKTAPTLESLLKFGVKKYEKRKNPFSYFWRRKRDSNPRGLSPKRFSRPPRYDRFDIPAYVI